MCKGNLSSFALIHYRFSVNWTVKIILRFVHYSNLPYLQTYLDDRRLLLYVNIVEIFNIPSETFEVWQTNLYNSKSTLWNYLYATNSYELYATTLFVIRIRNITIFI